MLSPHLTPSTACCHQILNRQPHVVTKFYTINRALSSNLTPSTACCHHILHHQPHAVTKFTLVWKETPLIGPTLNLYSQSVLFYLIKSYLYKIAILLLSIHKHLKTRNKTWNGVFNQTCSVEQVLEKGSRKIKQMTAPLPFLRFRLLVNTKKEK